jgi:hypothetical protein
MVQLASMGIWHCVKLIVIYSLGLPLAVFGHWLFLVIVCFWPWATAQDSSMTNVDLCIALADALIADA